MATPDPTALLDSQLAAEQLADPGAGPGAEPGQASGQIYETLEITPQILPYAFAKRHGVLIGQIGDEHINLIHHGHPDPVVLAEVSRITHRRLTLTESTVEQFAALLAQTYEQGSDQAMAMMEGVGEELDLDELVYN